MEHRTHTHPAVPAGLFLLFPALQQIVAEDSDGNNSPCISILSYSTVADFVEASTRG
jgi:hypothetical protein